MSTPAIATTGAEIVQTLLDQFLGTPGKHAVKAIFARVRYNGTTWEVHSTTDSQEFTTANVTFSSNHAVLTISGFSLAPVCFVAAVYNASGIYVPSILAVSANELAIGWWDFAGALVTTPDTKMDCYVLALGS